MPVNVLVGLEALKAGFGWSDEELYENHCYNLQVRYALGYDRLGDGDFEIRTLYYFRERLSKYLFSSWVAFLSFNKAGSWDPPTPVASDPWEDSVV